MGGHVLFCGAWDDGPGYPRTATLRAGLVAGGVEVRDCALLAQWAQRRALHRDLRQAIANERPRCIVVPYPGHHVVAGIRARSDVPVVLDLFLSAYDTAIEDRRLAEPGSLAAGLLHRLDARACAAADLVLLDTPENAAYVAALTGLPAEHFGWMPVSDPAANAVAAPWPTSADGVLRILFFGTGVPLHGLATLVEAVAAAPQVELTLVGGTREDRARAGVRLGGRLALAPEFVDRARLQELLGHCQLVAGVFGASNKTQRVVPWKVVHALAAGRPVITADTPAICGWLDGSDAVFLVPAAEPARLAETLRGLAAEPARVARAAAAARPAYDRHFSAARCGERWGTLLERAAALHARRQP